MKLRARCMLGLGLVAGVVVGAGCGKRERADGTAAKKIASAALEADALDAALQQVEVLAGKADATQAELDACLRELRRAVHRGSADALLGSGRLIVAHGPKTGHTREEAESFIWAAAVLGSADAAAQLGYLHRDATGVTGSVTERAWGRVSALLGGPFQQFWYGFALESLGNPTKELSAEARGWLVLAQRGPLDAEARADFAKEEAGWTVAQRRAADTMADQLELEAVAFRAKFGPVRWTKFDEDNVLDGRCQVLEAEHARFERELEAASRAQAPREPVQPPLPALPRMTPAAPGAWAGGAEPELLPEFEALLARQATQARAEGGDMETYILGAHPILRKMMAAQTVCHRTRVATWPAFQIDDLTRDGHREDGFRRLRRALTAAAAACDAQDAVHRTMGRDLEAMVATRHFSQPGIAAEFAAQFAKSQNAEKVARKNRAAREIFVAMAAMYERAALAQEPERVIAQEWPRLRQRIYAAELQGTLLDER